MSKFKVGQTVRVTLYDSKLYNAIVVIDSIKPNSDWPYVVVDNEDNYASFSEKELTEVDDMPKTVGEIVQQIKNNIQAGNVFVKDPEVLINAAGGIKFDQGSAVVNEKGGVKNFGGKIQPRLLFQSMPDAVEEVVSVLTYGSQKYSPDNWKKVDDFAYHDAFQRHYLKYCKGERLDAESGKEHIAHMICSLFFLLQKDLERNE